MRKVYKYGTGKIIPRGAVYLTSFVENLLPTMDEFDKRVPGVRLVWHYFLVDTNGKNGE